MPVHGLHVGRRRREPRNEDEPSLDGLELEEVGGELIHVIDCTEGGAPFGPTLAELRRVAELDDPKAGWVRAKRALLEVLAEQGHAVVDVGRVTKIGSGLSRDVYGAWVEHDEGGEQRYAVSLPRDEAGSDLDDRAVREARLLAWLNGLALPFRTPTAIGTTRDDAGHVVLVCTHVRGEPLDLRAERQHAVKPWEIVGTIAAAIHAVSGEDVVERTIGFATRRAHAKDALRVLEGVEAPELGEAAAWALEHLPPDEPSSLVHGDLLGQNILLGLGEPHAVIDWEHAMRGDPAYDLAIITRGVKQPFQIAAGLEKLLEAYAAHGGRAVTREHVQLHELCLFARWYREALAGRGAHSPAVELDRFRSLLRRLR